MKNKLSRNIFFCIFSSLIFLLSGCGGTLMPTADNKQLSANDVFKQLYSVATLAVTANGNQAHFQWRHGQEDFPYEQASWADSPIQPCNNDGKSGDIKFEATTYNQNLGTDQYQEQIENVRSVWQDKGLTVKSVGSSKGLMQIATEIENVGTVTYTAGSAGESVEVTSICIDNLRKEDRSNAEVFTGDKAN